MINRLTVLCTRIQMLVRFVNALIEFSRVMRLHIDFIVVSHVSCKKSGRSTLNENKFLKNTILNLLVFRQIIFNCNQAACSRIYPERKMYLGVYQVS